MAESDILDQNAIIFLKLSDAHEGIIGIVAGKLCEKYHHPFIVGSEKEGLVKASARSIPLIDIYEMLSAASSLYLKFGVIHRPQAVRHGRKNLKKFVPK
jgi:single-stranded DNA-specific DHH superfamily exonuclease